MKRFLLTVAIGVSSLLAQPPATPQKKAAPPPPVVAKPEELAKIREKSEQIESLVKELRAKHADPALLGDVEVYAKAGRMLLEFPELFGTQNAIDHSFTVLD